MIGKALIFTDLHFGRKQQSQEKINEILSYLSNEISNSSIETVFFLGDTFDNRKIIDWYVFNRVIEFFESFKNINFYIIVGNHDIYYKNRIDENSVSFLGKVYPNINIIEKTTMINFNDKKLLFVPWLVSDEDENTPTKKQISECNMILGHFEFAGFDLTVGVKSSHGTDHKIYSKKPVLSGHFHVSSETGKIKYLGTCQQTNWTDFDTKKGYHILNEDLSLEFIENKTSERYIKIYLDSTKNEIILNGYFETKKFNSPKDMLSCVDIKNHTIKVYVKDNRDKIFYNNFFITLNMNYIDYIIIDITPEMDELIHYNQEEKQEDLSELLLKFIEEDSKKIFNEIYTEALTLSE